jgi:hypothetical protein
MPEPVSNAIASASELVVRFGNQAVLDHATLTLSEGERAAPGFRRRVFLKQCEHVVMSRLSCFVVSAQRTAPL